MANQNRIGARGDIHLEHGKCNKEVGKDGLEKLATSTTPQEYISNKDCTLDVQINIEKFGQVLQDGINNTKEMAETWKWSNDNQELNWRDTPCSLRISYDKNSNIFKIHVWNELTKLWLRLSLTKKEILQILEG